MRGIKNITCLISSYRFALIIINIRGVNIIEDNNVPNIKDAFFSLKFFFQKKELKKYLIKLLMVISRQTKLACK